MRLYPALMHKLAQQSKDHLRRGVHIIQVAHQIVGLWIDAPADNASHQVHFDRDLLPLLISDLSVATSLVEVSEKGVPGFRIAGLSAKSLNYPRHHAIHRRLAGMITFP